ncbi:TRAP transporter large permease subunit [Bradyrhizobium centrolobii]|uniref:TRAP transporter large permease n=1 Tax=Bradyrhizobium centrolobii TaxID=1505087 RepID=UPI000ADE72AB|nr:TRAP transporter large permease subunit [Bradyrhizobium centrolobii]
MSAVVVENVSAPSRLPPEALAGVVHPTLPANIIERYVGATAGVLGAALVVVEIGILGWGVFARYVLDNPATWTDEVATILFIWLSMIGAVIALQRGEHMRLTAAVDMLPQSWQPRFDAFAHVVSATFLAIVSWYAIQYTIAQADAITQALEIADSWRASALPVAFLAMLLIELGRLGRHRPTHLAGSAAIAAAILVLLFAFRGTWLAWGPMSLTVFFGPLVILFIFSGAPIAFCFASATIAYLYFGTGTPLTIVLIRMDVGMSNMLLLAVPMFIFLGLLIEVVGIAKTMVSFLVTLLGHVRGGLEYVLLGAMFLVSGISGSKVADMAAVAPVLLPEMKQLGNDPGRMVALLAASGVMAETIPPSLVLITVGAVAGVSIASLFAGGVLPAAVAALALVIFVSLQSRRSGAKSERASARDIWNAFLLAAPGLLLPLLIRFFVLEGITTATEVSTIGVFYSLVVGLCTWRKVAWRRLFPIMVETAALSGAVLLIIGAATAMAWALTQSGFSRGLVQVMSGTGSVVPFMALSILVFIVLGSVLEGLPVIVLFGPLVFPVARALQINDVHYAMVIILAMGLGVFAPPFGLAFYAACGIGRVDPSTVMKCIWPYLGVLLLALLVIATFPVITTALL